MAKCENCDSVHWQRQVHSGTIFGHNSGHSLLPFPSPLLPLPYTYQRPGPHSFPFSVLAPQTGSKTVPVLDSAKDRSVKKILTDWSCPDGSSKAVSCVSFQVCDCTCVRFVFCLRCDQNVLLGDRQLQGSFTLFHVCRAQDAELRPLFGSRKRPSAARSVFHMVAELLKNVQGA